MVSECSGDGKSTRRDVVTARFGKVTQELKTDLLIAASRAISALEGLNSTRKVWCNCGPPVEFSNAGSEIFYEITDIGLLPQIVKGSAYLWYVCSFG